MDAVYVIDTTSLLHFVGLSASPVFPNYDDSQRVRLWHCLDRLIDGNRLRTVSFVMEEIQRHHVATYRRLKERQGFVHGRLNPLIPEVSQVLQQFPELARADAETDSADPWVIALAMSNDWTVVANEFPATSRRRRSDPRIPDACRHFNVPCIDIDVMFRNEGCVPD